MDLGIEEYINILYYEHVTFFFDASPYLSTSSSTAANYSEAAVENTTVSTFTLT